MYNEIESSLREKADPQFAKSRNRLIDENLRSYGVRLPDIRKIARRYPAPNLQITERLLSAEIFDIQLVGVYLAASLNSPKSFIDEANRLNTYQEWVEKYIKNWALCDTFATEVFSRALQGDKQTLRALNSLASSQNKWARRMALVSLVKASNRIEDYDEILISLLPHYEGEDEPIVKKALQWAKRARHREKALNFP